MHIKKKQLLSLFLSFVMILGIMPIKAIAEELQPVLGAEAAAVSAGGQYKESYTVLIATTPVYDSYTDDSGKANVLNVTQKNNVKT